MDVIGVVAVFMVLDGDRYPVAAILLLGGGIPPDVILALVLRPDWDLDGF